MSAPRSTPEALEAAGRLCADFWPKAAALLNGAAGVGVVCRARWWIAAGLPDPPTSPPARELSSRFEYVPRRAKKPPDTYAEDLTAFVETSRAFAEARGEESGP